MPPEESKLSADVPHTDREWIMKIYEQFKAEITALNVNIKDLTSTLKEMEKDRLSPLEARMDKVEAEVSERKGFNRAWGVVATIASLIAMGLSIFIAWVKK